MPSTRAESIAATSAWTWTVLPPRSFVNLAARTVPCPWHPMSRFFLPRPWRDLQECHLFWRELPECQTSLLPLLLRPHHLAGTAGVPTSWRELQECQTTLRLLPHHMAGTAVVPTFFPTSQAETHEPSTVARPMLFLSTHLDCRRRASYSPTFPTLNHHYCRHHHYFRRRQTTTHTTTVSHACLRLPVPSLMTVSAFLRVLTMFYPLQIRPCQTISSNYQLLPMHYKCNILNCPSQLSLSRNLDAPLSLNLGLIIT